MRGDHCYAANKPGCGGWKSAWGFREGPEAASGNPNGSGEADATRRSEQRKDAEKEWSWLRDLNGSSGLSEVESGGPSAQRCTGGFEPGLSLVLSPAAPLETRPAIVTGWPLPAGVPKALGLPLSLRKVARQRRKSGPRLFLCRVSNCPGLLGTEGAARLQDFGV